MFDRRPITLELQTGMGRIHQYIEVLLKIKERLWFKWCICIWTLLATYDLMLAELIPEEYAKKAPRAWEAAVITGGLLPWWGWTLLLAAIIIAASFEYAIHLKNSVVGVGLTRPENLSSPSQVESPIPFYFTAYEAVHYLADS